MQRTALVTGGNRGIGYAVCQQLAALGHDVWLSARNIEGGQQAAARLSQEAGRLIRFVPLDLANPEAPEAARQTLRATGHRIDILVNNGAVLIEGGLLDTTTQALRTSFDINVHGAIACIRAFAPDMVAADWGRIVNVSSGWGSFDEGLTGPAAYSVTKAALNAVTRNAANQLPASVKINSVCPGWVRSDMGGPGATRSLVHGASSVVWAATLPDSGPTGGFFRDGRPVAW